jgi:predicted Ser/Thr protein kinase
LGHGEGLADARTYPRRGSLNIDRARAFRIFAAAYDVPERERGRFLDEECGADLELKREIEEYLKSASQPDIDTQSLSRITAATEESLVGRGIGRFRLIERVGSGGMGVVYRAERVDGVAQSVALKIVSSLLESSARKRFEGEAQLLARLEHPSIARLIDAGTEEGRPWIAMEFVRGRRIDEHCAELSLSPREIVQLLVQLADAVAAAHAMLVVHSDIKPANVLVTDTGLPKLIDFGIATALRDSVSKDAPTVNVGRLFSPHYAAPEQIEGAPVTVATDVFGLGALAYRLLSGSAPHADAESPMAYLTAITQRDVVPPSQAASKAGRKAELAKLLQGDLDAIVCKALDRDPARRYRSATEMRADLLRYLERRPVAARPASMLYRANRFLRRNAVAVLLTNLLAVSLIGGGVFALIQARRAEAARDAARAVTDFLTHDILAAANPMVAGTRDVQLRPLLDEASKTLTTRFSGQPLVLAEIQAAMGTGYAALFDTQKAEALLSAAEQGLAAELGDADAQTQATRMALWYLYVGNLDIGKLSRLSARMGAAERAAGRMISPIAYRANLMSAWIPCVARAPAMIGMSDCGDVVRPFYASALAKLGLQDLVTNEMAWFLGVALVYSSREDQAEPILRTACNGLQRYYGPLHHRLTACRRFLAWALDRNGKSAEAEPILAQVVANFDKTLGPNSKFTTIAGYELAGASMRAGHAAAAVEAARRAARDIQKGDAAIYDVWVAQLILADALAHAYQSVEGISLGEQTLVAAIKEKGAEDLDILTLRALLSEVYLSSGRRSEAEALLRENRAVAERMLNRPAWFEGEIDTNLAHVLVVENRLDEARQLVETALPVLNGALGANNQRTLTAQRLLSQLTARR